MNKIDFSNIKSIGLDFDGTVVEESFPDIGIITEKHMKVIKFVWEAHLLGVDIVLNTCREDTDKRKYLSEALAFCTRHSIPLDYVNEYPKIKVDGIHSRKICVDLYIDTKSINMDFFDWLYIIKLILLY